MLQDFKTYLLYGNQYCGVEHTSDNGQVLIHGSVLKKQKKEVNIDSQTDANSVEELSKTVAKNTPVFLIVNNENVLTKKVDVESKDALKLVHTAFPNINLTDFFYEVIIQNEIHFVSICRKSYVMDIIETYRKNNISVINISFGNSIVSSIFDFIGSNQIFTSNANIEISDDEITAIEKIDVTDLKIYDLNGLGTTNKSILSTSAALVSVLGNQKNITNFETEKQQLQDDFLSITFFRQFLKFGLILILSLLLINFLIFNHYFNEVAALEQTSQINQEAKSQVVELNENVLKSQKKVEDMLNNSTSKSSYFVNGIVQELPETIQLIGLNYQPLLKRIKAEESISIESNSILISGESLDSEEFSKWTNQLEKKNWIHKVEVIDYSDVSQSLSNFSIKIHMNNDEQD